MSFSTRVLFLGSTFAASFTAGSACKFDDKNENHCVHNEGDAYCVEKHGAERGFCGGGCVDSEDNDGCVADAPSDLSCYSPCGDDKYADEDDSCLDTSTMTETNASTMDSTDTDPSGSATDDAATTMSSNTQGSETEDAGTTTESGGDCQTSAECTNADFPVCLDNECVPCTSTPDGDLACNSKDEALPVCNDGGQCVQCLPGNAAACGDTTPVCDEGTSACVGCTYHEQCSETACDIATGACFEDCVIDVVDTETIGDLVADGCVLLVHPGAFVESVQIDAGATVAILAAEGEFPSVLGDAGNAAPTFDISGGAVVYLQGIEVSQNNGLGIAVDGATVYLDRTRAIGNDSGGIALANAASAFVRNSFLGGANNQPAVDVNASSFDAVYATLGGTFGASPGLSCSSPVGVTVRNSIIVSQGTEELACDEADITYSATEQAVAGMGNVAVGTLLELQWFVGYDGGDFSLTPGGAGTGEDVFADIALWTTGDPSVDIGGDARPAVDETTDFAGADTP